MKITIDTDKFFSLILFFVFWILKAVIWTGIHLLLATGAFQCWTYVKEFIRHRSAVSSKDRKSTIIFVMVVLCASSLVFDSGGFLTTLLVIPLLFGVEGPDSVPGIPDERDYLTERVTEIARRHAIRLGGVVPYSKLEFQPSPKYDGPRYSMVFKRGSFGMGYYRDISPPSPLPHAPNSIVGLAGMQCPITLAIMRDPVVAADGMSYERRALEQWFALGNVTSPATNLKLPMLLMVPNRALRDVIEDYVRDQVEGMQIVAAAAGAEERLPGGGASGAGGVGGEIHATDGKKNE